MAKPITVGALRKLLKGLPDNVRVILLSDEEGNSLHHLYDAAVDNVKAPQRLYLTPAGEELEVEEDLP